MNHPLDGARLKVVRAQEHLDSLKAEIRMYLDEQPHEVRSEPKHNVHPAYPHIEILRDLTPAPPPLRFSAIIGDCVTNVRAALDYIVWELAQRHFVPSFDIANRNDRRIVSFPLSETATDAGLKNRLNSLTNRKIPAGAITEIEAAQPYNAGYEPLWWLHELVNRDKYRMPLLTTGEFDDITITFATPPLYQDLIKQPATVTVPRNRQAATHTMQSNVQMKGEVAIYVTWKDISVPLVPVDRTLEQIIETVTNVIPRFDRFF